MKQFTNNFNDKIILTYDLRFSIYDYTQSDESDESDELFFTNLTNFNLS
jgi:hypothetical protein